MAVQRFEAEVQAEGNQLYVEVPDAVIAALGAGRRPPVLVEINGFRYPSTPAVYGGRTLLGFRREVRDAAGLGLGQRVAVRFELDEERLDQARRRRIEGKATDAGPGPKDG